MYKKVNKILIQYIDKGSIKNTDKNFYFKQIIKTQNNVSLFSYDLTNKDNIDKLINNIFIGNQITVKFIEKNKKNSLNRNIDINTIKK
jgi:hypothetical protein